MKYLRKSDIFVTLIILLLDTFLVFLFFASMYASSSYGATEKLGTLIFKKRAATRKHVNALSWNVLQNNTPVYELDVIRTASQSEASIEFDDGSSIDLLENTLIRLKSRNSTDLGDFVHGSLIFTSGDTKKSINVGGKVIVMDEHSEIVVHKKGDDESEIEVTKGAVEVEKDNVVVKVEEAQSINIQDEGNKVEIQNIECLPLTPSQNARLVTSEDSFDVNFSWILLAGEEIQGKVTSSLIIASDKDFKNIIKKIPSSSTSSASVYSASYNVSVGTLYWKVEYANGETSSIRRLNLEKITQIEPLRPYPDETFYYYDDEPSINFSWTPSLFSASSMLEIADSPDFASPIVRMQVSPSSIELNKLGEGKYYWRVFPNTNKKILGELEAPVVRSFNVVQKEVLNAVKLKFPIDAYLCNVNVFQTSGLSFTWESKAEADSYELLLYKDKNAEKPSESFTSNLPFIKLKADMTGLFDDVGEIYFSVRYKSRRGNFSDLAARRSVKKVNYDVNLKSLYPPDGYNISESLIMSQRFSWKHNLPLKTFFVVATDKNFTNIVVEKENSIFSITGLNLKIGKYFWQVRVYNTDNSIFAQTETKTFSIVGPLDIPALLSPREGSDVAIMEDKDLEVRWQDVKGADYYDVVIYRNDGKKVLDYPKMKGTSIRLPINKYGSGRYTVALQAFSLDSELATRNVGYKGHSNFSSTVLTYVKLVEPIANMRLEGIDAYTKGMKFSYKTQEKYDKLSLSLIRNGRAVNTRTRHDGVRHFIEIPSLTSGEYEWGIDAFMNGHDISSKERRRFTVLPIPPLPAPQFVKKKMVEQIGVEYLTAKRSIHFEWRPVDEASYYVVQLQNKDNGQIIKTFSNWKGTSYDFSEIEKLNVGKFLFKVKAVALLGRDNEIRGGYESSYQFEISLPKLENIEVKDEEYYGY